MTDNRIFYPQQPLIPIQNSSASLQTGINKKTAPSGPSFEQVLQKEVNGVKFSQHALQRLQTRNISLNQADLNKLNGAVEKAAEKGAKESLILMDNNLALVVSVKNKTVITAIDHENLKSNVFTNIDSAVIL